MKIIYKKRKGQIIFSLQGQDNELLKKYNTIQYNTRTQLQLCVQWMAKERMLGAVMNMKTRYKYSKETTKTEDRWIMEDTANNKQKINDMKKISPNQGMSGVKIQCKHMSRRGFIQL
jgi:hypothetical protein